MAGVEAPKTRDEPADRKGWCHVDVQLLSGRLSHRPTGELELVESLADVAGKPRTVRGQHALTALCFEQWRAEPSLQRTHLMSDGRGCDAQLIRCFGER